MQTIITKLAGVSFRPAEIKSLIAEMDKSSQLELEREADNAYDGNAVRVLIQTDDDGGVEFIGYVSAADGTAAILAPIMDAGSTPTVYVHNVSGLSVTLEIEYDETADWSADQGEEDSLDDEDENDDSSDDDETSSD